MKGTVLSISVGGEIYIWDLKAQDCLQRFVDDGSIRGTSIAVSKNNRYLAAGSDSGVVNIYNRNALTSTTQANPKPEKVSQAFQLRFPPNRSIFKEHSVQCARFWINSNCKQTLGIRGTKQLSIQRLKIEVLISFQCFRLCLTWQRLLPTSNSTQRQRFWRWAPNWKRMPSKWSTCLQWRSTRIFPPSTTTSNDQTA